MVLRDGAFLTTHNPSTVLEFEPSVCLQHTLLLAIGILTTGFVMLKGIFSKGAAYLGLAAGILGILSVAGAFFVSSVGAAIIATSVLTTVWVLVVGFKLYILGSR